MNFPTICIWWGLASLPWGGRGQQGRNPAAAETGSLRLEFPSCYRPSSETPHGCASPGRLLRPPPSSRPGPSSSCQDTNTQSTWLSPGRGERGRWSARAAPSQHSLPKPPGEEVTDLHGSWASHKLLEPDRGPPLKEKVVTSCRQHAGASFTQPPTEAQPISETGRLIQRWPEQGRLHTS